jgi:hypothetical protein
LLSVFEKPGMLGYQEEILMLYQVYRVYNGKDQLLSEGSESFQQSEVGYWQNELPNDTILTRSVPKGEGLLGKAL